MNIAIRKLPNFKKMVPQKADSALFPSFLQLNLESTDAEQMREQSAFWSYEHKQFGTGKFHGKILAIHTARIQLSLAQRTTGIFMRGAPPSGTAIITFPLSPHPLLYYRGQAMENNQVVALLADEEIELQTSNHSTLITVAICEDFLKRQSLAITGKPFDALRYQARLFLCSDEYRKLSEYLVSLLYHLRRSQHQCTKWEEEFIEKEIVETILTGVRTPVSLSKMSERVNIAGHVECYMRKNLKRPDSINEISQLFETSERSLYRSFKERFGVSPKAYVQMMRLNGVHKDLRTKPLEKSVSDTAMEWGFYHLGRFSQQYNRMFGELPSTTRKRESSLQKMS